MVSRSHLEIQTKKLSFALRMLCITQISDIYIYEIAGLISIERLITH